MSTSCATQSLLLGPFVSQNTPGVNVLVAEIVGQVHRGHAALTEFTLDGIATF
jgi:hypothetical protein